ncbi:hypothetical protein RhiirB3_460743 [Rhizophagus irregularis]|nr:hypothetical protein RhiirB3_460743 [Rhizophagus irregularis]
MSVDAPRDIKSIHDYVNDELMRNGHFLGPDWPDYYSDLVLEMLWFQENGATLDICNSKLLLER